LSKLKEIWKAAVLASGIPELISFVDGLADDAQAVANGCTESWSNGMVEGFINKVKWIKRSSYGQAGFPLLPQRVLLHPAQKATTGRQGNTAKLSRNYGKAQQVSGSAKTIRLVVPKRPAASATPITKCRNAGRWCSV
jgi:hypothetical protein